MRKIIFGLSLIAGSMIFAKEWRRDSGRENSGYFIFSNVVLVNESSTSFRANGKPVVKFSTTEMKDDHIVLDGLKSTGIRVYCDYDRNTKTVVVHVADDKGVE